MTTTTDPSDAALDRAEQFTTPERMDAYWRGYQQPTTVNPYASVELKTAWEDGRSQRESEAAQQ